jgi:hypothetical protein
MLIQIASLIVVPAGADITLAAPASAPPADRTAGGLGVAWGGGGQDQLTVGGVALVATGGPYVALSDTFSVDIRAQGQITVNAAGGLTVGDTITFTYANGSGTAAVTTTLTVIAGARAPGSTDITAVAGAAAQAANIATTINDCVLSTAGPQEVMTASVAGPVVTVTAGAKEEVRGASGNAPQRGTGRSFRGITVSSSLATAADLTLVQFTGGVNADGGITTTTDRASDDNREVDYLANIAVGLNNGAGFAAVISQAALDSSTPKVIAQVLPLGAGGNGVVLTENTAGARLSVTSPTAGGVDAVPASIAAATSTVIPPGSAITLALGSEGNRQALGTDAYWGVNSGSGYGLIAQMEAGGPADLNVTYINNRGYPEGV